MRSLSPGLHPARIFIQCTSVQNKQKTGFIDKKELILLLATPIFKNLRSINVGECRRLMFMSEISSEKKKEKMKKEQRIRDPWTPITNNSDKNLSKCRFFSFLFHIPFTIKTFKRPLCVAMRSVRFYRCVRCTIIWGAFVLEYW